MRSSRKLFQPRFWPILLLAISCATTQRTKVEMEALRVDVNREDLELSKLNDEELLACGTAALQAQDYRRAANCFTRLADLFSESRHRLRAQFHAGLAYEALGEHLLAIERFRGVMNPATGTGDAIDATWHAASAYYHLGDYSGAVELLKQIAARDDLTSTDKIHSLTHLGVCYVELDDIALAEATLRQALSVFRERAELERIEDYYPGQAQFFLAEIYRLRFQSVRLDAVDDTKKLAEDLEHKAQLLLSAQGHYLRAIRIGNSHWAVASGQRIGRLYEELYQEMITSPPPSSLDNDQAALYNALLRKRVRVLIRKAISTYERTISAAERVSVSSAFLEETRSSLDRMKQVLLAGASDDEENTNGEVAPPNPDASAGDTATDPNHPPSAEPPEPLPPDSAG